MCGCCDSSLPHSGAPPPFVAAGPHGPRSPSPLQRLREFSLWVVPSVTLVLVPKCPACLAAYLAVWTGLGVSFSTAASLRWGLVTTCVVSLIFLTAVRLDHVGVLFRSIRKDTERCRTK